MVQQEAKDIDDLDREIILELQEDARRPYKTIAKKLGISEGTVKNRVTRLVDRGILVLEARVNPFALPNRVAALVAVNMKDRSHEKAMKAIKNIPGVLAVWNSTGRYDLFFELMVDSMQGLNDVLFRKHLTKIDSIASTETFVVLSSETKLFKLS
jgi:Lrp/AsnC family transcriptional regulator for asnA, asnC and gidA